jgi:outer membrane protein OmpU
MKKALCGSTALVAVGLIAGGAAAAERIKLGIGGYFQAFGIYVDEDDGAGEPGANRREHGLAREAEIEFRGKTTLDNGIEVGVEVELEAETCADQLDQSYVWFEGGFGQVRLGNHYGASYEMFYGAPTPIAGHGVNTPNFLHLQVGGNAIVTPVTYVTATVKSEKATYFTPRIAGFQFGLSYTPDACEENNPGGAGSGTGVACGGSYGGAELDNNVGQQSEAFEVGLNWVGSFLGADIGAYGGFASADVESDPGGVFEDLTVWGVGANAAIAGFVVGASFRHSDQGLSGGNNDRIDWNVGVAYAWGDWTVGAMFGRTEAEAGAAGGEDELDGLEIGAQYALAPGVVLTGGVQFWDLDDNAGAAANENDATVLIFGTAISF